MILYFTGSFRIFVATLPVQPVSKMPRIENDIKLDFKDVLLRPKRSTLKSRSEVGKQLWVRFSTRILTDLNTDVSTIWTLGCFSIWLVELKSRKYRLLLPRDCSNTLCTITVLAN